MKNETTVDITSRIRSHIAAYPTATDLYKALHAASPELARGLTRARRVVLEAQLEMAHNRNLLAFEAKHGPMSLNDVDHIIGRGGFIGRTTPQRDPVPDKTSPTFVQTPSNPLPITDPETGRPLQEFFPKGVTPFSKKGKPKKRKPRLVPKQTSMVTIALTAEQIEKAKSGLHNLGLIEVIVERSGLTVHNIASFIALTDSTIEVGTAEKVLKALLRVRNIIVPTAA